MCFFDSRFILLYVMKFNFCLYLLDHEIEELTNLMLTLLLVYLSSTFFDVRVWSLISLDMYSVNSFFKALSISSNLSSFLLEDFVWKSKTPSKVKAFAWDLFYLSSSLCALACVMFEGTLLIIILLDWNIVCRSTSTRLSKKTLPI